MMDVELAELRSPRPDASLSGAIMEAVRKRGTGTGPIRLSPKATTKAPRPVSLRALNTGDAPGLVSQAVDVPFGTALRNASLLGRLGAKFLTAPTTAGGGMGAVMVPRFSTGSVAQWIAEDEEAGEEPVYIAGDLVVPRRVVAWVDVTRTWVSGTPRGSVERDWAAGAPEGVVQVENDLIAAIAAAVDTAVLAGGGEDLNQPLGMISREDIDAVSLGTDGGPLTLAKLGEAELLLTQRGFAPGDSLAWLLSPGARIHAKATPKIAGSPVYLCDDVTGLINESPSFPHSGLPDDLEKGTGTGLGSAIWGSWPEVRILSFGPVEIQANPYRFDISGVVRIVASLYVNYGLSNPGAFVRFTDIDTA